MRLHYFSFLSIFTYYFILFGTVPFHPIVPLSFHSISLYSVPVYTIVFRSVMFLSILLFPFPSIVFHSIMSLSTPLPPPSSYSLQFYCILFHPILIELILFYWEWTNLIHTRTQRPSQSILALANKARLPLDRQARPIMFAWVDVTLIVLTSLPCVHRWTFTSDRFSRFLDTNSSILT